MPAVIAAAAGLGGGADARFFLVEESGIGRGHPFSGEKLSLVLAVYRARDFAHAKALCRELLDHQGRGHSVGIHTRRPERARELAADLDVVRVLVNQAHTFGNGGGFDNGLPFTLSMGCGTWAGNSIAENLNWRHFINVTHLVTHDRRGPARRGGAVRPLLASATADESSRTCGKALLARAGIAVPDGEVVEDAAAAARVARVSGLASSRRRSAPAGAARRAASGRPTRREEARAAAEAILGMDIGGERVARLLVERRLEIARELYAAVLTDAGSRGPLLLVAGEGGMEVEELAARAPGEPAAHPGRHPSRHRGGRARAAAGGARAAGSPRCWRSSTASMRRAMPSWSRSIRWR